jgi:hypothetical protein
MMFKVMRNLISNFISILANHQQDQTNFTGQAASPLAAKNGGPV